MTRISYTIHTADILSLGYTADEIDTYETNLEAALTAAYPDADVNVEQVKRVSGGTVIRVEADEDARRIEADVREIANRALEAIQ